MTGEVTIGSDPSGKGRFFQVGCWKCIGCRKRRLRMWTVRLMHEAQMHWHNRFVTLTYAPEHVGDGSLNYRHVQLLLKRLRRRGGFFSGEKGPLRYFCAGEYGEKFKRPHFHLLMFNFRPADELVWQNGARRSKELCDEWAFGDVDIGMVEPGSCAYVAGYAMKKGYGRERLKYDIVDRATGEVTTRRREFAHMSKGIGAGWFKKYAADLFPVDHAVVDGKKYAVPRYYGEKYRARYPAEYEDIIFKRLDKAEEVSEEFTAARLRVREEYERRRDKFFDSRKKL